MREVVLDTRTGLPEVRASRSDEGHLTFRYHTIRSGGMSVWEPLTDEALRAMDDVDAQEVAVRMREAQLVIARQVAERAQAHTADVEGLRERLEAAEQLIVEAEQRARDAEQSAAEAQARIEELVASAEAEREKPPTTRRPRANSRAAA